MNIDNNMNESFRKFFISAIACFESHTTEFIEQWMKVSTVATENYIKTNDVRYNVFPKCKRYAEYMTNQINYSLENYER